jgi:3-isopropylmalate/(R)-2-methylmalate dehydratase small subunit
MPKPLAHLVSRCVPLNRDHVDTDQIMPARFLKVTSKEGLGKQCFADWRYLEDGVTPNPDFVLNQPAFAHARILVAGQNFGCGSSREHAPWGLVDYGFEAIIASSFADIFKNNALKNGLLPITLPEAVVAELRATVEENPKLAIEVDVEAQMVQIAGMGTFEFELNPFWKACLINGLDQVGYTLRFDEQIKAFEATHPLYAVAAAG